MKLKTKLLTIIAPAALLTTVAPIALTSCGGGGDTPTGDRTNKISFTQSQAIINYGQTFSIDMTLEKELASGQKITGMVTNYDIKTGGDYLKVESITTNGKTATVTFKYGTKPSKEDVDTFTVKFTGSTNDKTEWTNSVEKIKVTYSK